MRNEVSFFVMREQFHAHARLADLEEDDLGWMCYEINEGLDSLMYSRFAYMDSGCHGVIGGLISSVCPFFSLLFSSLRSLALSPLSITRSDCTTVFFLPRQRGDKPLGDALNP